MTTVVVGQPLDTVKVRMQGLPSASKQSSYQVAKELFFKEGVVGLYRGGLPLVVGGSMMRSAQFGVSGSCKTFLENNFGGKTKDKDRVFFGLIDWQVVVAGIAGGLGRGLVETPTDFLKTRRQVEKGWTIRHLLDGTAITLGRNTFLYSSFVFYIDLSKQLCKAGYVPSILMQKQQQQSDNKEVSVGLTPFAKGAICANLAWLTVWPADVIKTQRQSGNYEGKSTLQLLQTNVRSGKLFRGILPGLVRSTVANGSSMVIYEKVHTGLTNYLDLERKDMT